MALSLFVVRILKQSSLVNLVKVKCANRISRLHCPLAQQALLEEAPLAVAAQP